MADDQNIFNLGEHGIDLVSSPLHAKDGSLQRGQNAEFFLDRGKGGIRQRPPLRRLISSAVAQAIGGFATVPLNDPYVYSTYALDNANAVWKVSNDLGVTWAAANTDILALTDATVARYAYSTDPGVSHASGWRTNMGLLENGRRKAYWIRDPSAPGSNPGGGANPAITGIIAFDGTRTYELVHTGSRIPSALFLYQGALYFAMTVFDATPSSYGLYKVDLVTSEVSLAPLALIGDDAVSGTPYREVVNSGLSHLGRVWWLTGYKDAGTNAREARVLSAHPESTAWTEERVAAGDLEHYTDGAVFQGNLYVGTLASDGTAAIIEKRTPAGVWSTVRTGTSAVRSNIFYGLKVYDGALYAIYGQFYGSAVVEIHKFDGSSWTTDMSYTAGTDGGGFTTLPWKLQVVGTTLFVVYAQAIGGVAGQRKVGGAWSTMASASFAGTNHIFGV